ncbi:hypothetical protein [Citreimonas sp.]|uniref:hypothetical protein n=1 Tax=Citreimonas sp. TaxID=3036715 RepID=UPI0040595BC5
MSLIKKLGATETNERVAGAEDMVISKRNVVGVVDWFDVRKGCKRRLRPTFRQA